MSLGHDSQVLKQSASAPLLIVDVLVDGLVAYGEGSVDPEVVGDLLGAQVLFQQSDDVIPEVGGRGESRVARVAAWSLHSCGPHRHDRSHR